MSEIIITADTHIGNDRWPVSDYEYNEPLSEFVEYYHKNKIDLALVAGDLMHRRNSTVRALAYAQSWLHDLPNVHVVAGNHDSFSTPRSPSHIGLLQEGGLDYEPYFVPRDMATDVFIVCLPWPHYRVWEHELDLGTPIDQLLVHAEMRVYQQLESVLAHNKHNLPTLLVGHAHVYYGDSFSQQVYAVLVDGQAPASLLPESPRLLAGRDVLLSYKRLESMFNLVALGHIHDSKAKGYVGSTQPTDFADTGRKGFWHVTVDESGLGIHTKFIEYETALKVEHWQVRAEHISDLPDVTEHAVDVGRLTVQLVGNPTITVADAQRWLAYAARIPHGVSVLPLTRERRTEALGLTSVDFSDTREAITAWLQSKGQQAQQEGVLHELELIAGVQ